MEGRSSHRAGAMGFWTIIAGLFAILLIRLAFLFVGGALGEKRKPPGPRE
jgi:hypothetical protein